MDVGKVNNTNCVKIIIWWGDSMKVKFTVVIQKEENWYVAKCIENSVASQGKTIEEALDNLKEALELYYENGELDLEEKPLFITTVEVAI
nr:type II toxin-antitoxin system HicB family antitoxin [Thermoanaerobacter thermocopriae]